MGCLVNPLRGFVFVPTAPFLFSRQRLKFFFERVGVSLFNRKHGRSDCFLQSRLNVSAFWYCINVLRPFLYRLGVSLAHVRVVFVCGTNIKPLSILPSFHAVYLAVTSENVEVLVSVFGVLFLKPLPCGVLSILNLIYALYLSTRIVKHPYSRIERFLP